MQKGEESGRRSGLLKWQLIALVALLSCAGISRPHAAVNAAAWVAGRGGASIPSDELWLRDYLADSRFAGAVLSWSRPYALEDLTLSCLTAGCNRPPRAFWLDWRLLRHPLYREDRLTVKAGQRLFSGRLLLLCRSSGLFSRVRGFRAEASFEASFAMFLISEGFLCAGVEKRFIGNEVDRWGDGLFTASIQIGPVMFVMNRQIAAGAVADTRIGIEAILGGGLSLLSGYCLESNEISGGVLYAGSRLLVGISCCHHPVLGRTVSVGIGGVLPR